LQIQPGTDVALFHGMLHIMLWEGWINNGYIAAHTEGFDALKSLVREYTPELTALTCGIKKEDLLQATKWFAQSPASMSLYCQGLNQSSSGTAKNAALINLHLATAQIGKPGAGPFSLTGQPNAMGGREVGGLANLISAHRDMANPTHRAEVAALWGVADVPATPGKTAVEMFQAAADGQIKALWIACTNPAQSMPDLNLVRRALACCELVVVQEAFATTATCAYADVLLPATTWGEKTGTVTNSERRISRVRPAVAQPGETRHDWRIATQFAQSLQKRLGKTTPRFDYTSDESIWNEHRDSTRGRDLDITGLSYAMLDAQGPQQWPLPQGASTGKPRLYEDGVFPTASTKARFVASPYKPVAEARDARFPFSLNTGRLRDQWHGMSRTGTLGRLFGHVAEPCVQMHPQDMQRRFIKEGDFVHLTSRRGSITLPVQASTDVALSQCFVAMHWGAEFVSGRSSAGQATMGINHITTSAFCPSSKQPELKHTAVKLLKAELPWQVLAVAWMPEAHALIARKALQAQMPLFDYAACVPFANAVTLDNAAQQRHGVLFRAACFEGPDDVQNDARLNAIEAALNLGAQAMRFADKKRAQRRTAKLAGTAQAAGLEAFMLAGDVSAQAWIKEVLQRELPAQTYGSMLLVPSAKAPVEIKAAGAQICTCLNVSEPQIVEFLQTCQGSQDQRLAALQDGLKCGTNCGSCVPQLKSLVRGTVASLTA
jgi:assimilatory nitrate reductase catalytic subunit